MNKLKRYVKALVPPDKWKIPVIVALGVFTGLLFLVMHVSKATSYISDDPETCINCHVMYPQYSSWKHSSHARVTTCNDCHVPHDNIFNKYLFKATDGLRHSTMFTLRLEPQVIRIKEAGARVVQENCERCHSSLWGHVNAIKNIVRKGEDDDESERRCWDCHKETPHGKVSSLSSFPHSRVPGPGSVMPQWLEKFTSKKDN